MLEPNNLEASFNLFENSHKFSNQENMIKIPAFCGRAIQFPPLPCCSIYSFSFASSSGDHGPLFTFALSQQGALPISLSLSLNIYIYIGFINIYQTK